MKALNPDIGIVHAQYADAAGNAQIWGIEADDRFGVKASEKMIISAERIVDEEVIRRNPNLTIIDASNVDAVVEERWGAHPFACTGFYDFDVNFRRMYATMSRTIEGFNKFVEEWIYGVENREEYIQHYVEKFGYAKLSKLMAKPYWSLPVNLGY